MDAARLLNGCGLPPSGWEWCSLQRAEELKRDSSARQQAAASAPAPKAPKNFAQEGVGKSSSPGFAAFTFGRVFEVAYIGAALLAAKEYFSKGNVEVSDLQKKLADEFSAIENKPVTIAYLVAGLVAASTADFVFNFPVFNLLFPGFFQAIGIITAVGLYATYKEEGSNDPEDDLKALLAKVSADLPGLSSGKAAPAPKANPPAPKAEAPAPPPPAPKAEAPAPPPPAPKADPPSQSTEE